MRDRESTVRSRELGDALRAAMERSGLTAADIARKLAWSQSRVSRLLSGKRGTSETSVAAFMAIVGITGDEFDYLLDVSREVNASGLRLTVGSKLGPQAQMLTAHESKAVAINQFEPIVIPGLLQTPDYARAAVRASASLPSDGVETLVRRTIGRQSVFDRAPRVGFVFYIHEFALHLPVGGAEVMSAQLHHLLRLSVRPSITIRVVPATFGMHPGMCGAFELMDFPDIHPVVYLESETFGTFLEQPAETAIYRDILNVLADCALTPSHSRTAIAALATVPSPRPEDRESDAGGQVLSLS